MKTRATTLNSKRNAVDLAADIVNRHLARAMESAAHMSGVNGTAYVYRFVQAGTVWYAPTCFRDFSMSDALARVSLARQRAVADLQPLNNAPELVYTVTKNF